MEHKAELFYSDRRNIDKYFKIDSQFIRHNKTPWILNSRFLRSILRRIDKSPGLVRIVNKMNIYVHDHINRVQKDEQLALARRKKGSIVFVLRDFRAHSSLEKCVSEMRRAFDIKPDLTENIASEYVNLREKYKLLLGIHVRRGDYQEWRQGRYFFSDEVYANIIHEFITYKKISKEDVGVIICSNGAPLIENFSGLNVHYNQRPEEEDLFLMKRCDFILAPPSTFCSMASFMGSVPLYFIEPDETPEFESRLHICSY